MNLVDYFRVALKNLTRQKARTLLTIVAITVGSISLILMASIIIGIRQSLVKQLNQLGAFSLVSVAKDPNAVRNDTLIGNNGDPSEGKKMDDATLTAMRAIPHVAEATPILTPYVSTMRLDGSQKKAWGNVTGYDVANDVFSLSITVGRALQPTDQDAIVVGNQFVQDMGYGSHPSDLLTKKVLLNIKMGGGSAPDWGPLPEKPPQQADKSWYESRNNDSVDVPATIVGISNSGALDNGQSYITVDWARRLNTRVSWQWNGPQQKNEQGNNRQPQQEQQPTLTLQKDDGFTQQGYNSIILKVDDTANIDSVASAVKAVGYGANTGKAMLDQINKILTIIGAVLALIGGISLFVASIGIINTMIMATFERVREIGVMRACGATKATIRKLFTFEAALLGFWGGVFGIAISYGLAQAAHFIVNATHVSLGNIPIDEIGNFPWWLIVGVIAFTTVLGMVAGLYPAFRASRMNPVDALRYE